MKLTIPIKEQTSCLYCTTPFDKALRYCPLCRRPIKDNSGRHNLTIQALKQVPLTYDIPERVSIQINRGQGESETLKGRVTHETTTHYRVVGLSPYSFDEYFAKASNRVNCYPL